MSKVWTCCHKRKSCGIDACSCMTLSHVFNSKDEVFFCCTPEQGSDCRFTPPAVAASHWSLPVTGRRTDRRTDRVRRRCLLTHASLRHGISFQLDAPADFPGVIMKLFDVGRFLITEHSAGQIRFVMTAAPLWRAAGLVIGKTISTDCQYISLLLRAVGAAGVWF